MLSCTVDVGGHILPQPVLVLGGRQMPITDVLAAWSAVPATGQEVERVHAILVAWGRDVRELPERVEGHAPGHELVVHRVNVHKLPQVSTGVLRKSEAAGRDRALEPARDTPI